MGKICPRSYPDIAHMRYYLGPLKLKCNLSMKIIISLKFIDRFVYEKYCVLTTWKFIDFHVNPSLATNRNEQFVWG